MIFTDRGCIVWLKLLPPLLAMTASAAGIVVIARLRIDASWLTWTLVVAMATAALRLVYIGLAAWQSQGA